jgi:hypothetical protein
MARIAGINSGLDFGLDNPGSSFISPGAFQGYTPTPSVPKPKEDDVWDVVRGKKTGQLQGTTQGDMQGVGKTSGNALKDVLTVGQLIPGVGTFASVGQAGVSASEGDLVGTGINLAAAIPGLGTILKAPKLSNIAWRLGSKLGGLGRIGGLLK